MTQVLFLHINKCGGSTIRHMLNAVYPHNLQYPVPVGNSRKQEVYVQRPITVQRSMQKMQDANMASFSLVMGHYDWSVLELLPDDVTILTMLRNPVQQLYSMFRYFWVDTRNYGVLKDKYEYSGFEGFLEHDAHRFANQQTLFLSGRQWQEDKTLSTGVATYAKRNLRKCVFGLVERWDESIDLFEQAIGKPLPRDFHENHNEKRYNKPLSEDVIAQGEALQSYDMGLYDYAVKHFEEQFNGTD